MPKPSLTQYISSVDTVADDEIPYPQVVFRHAFEKDTEIIGYPKLRLIASPFVYDPRMRDDNPETNVDMDVFVGLRKRDKDGNVKNFINGFISDTYLQVVG